MVPARELRIGKEIFFHKAAFDAFQFFGLGVGDHGREELTADALAAEIHFESFAAEEAAQKVWLPHDALVFDEEIDEQQGVFGDLAVGIGGAGGVEFQPEIDETFRPFLGEFKNAAVSVTDELFHG